MITVYKDCDNEFRKVQLVELREAFFWVILGKEFLSKNLKMN